MPHRQPAPIQRSHQSCEVRFQKVTLGLLYTYGLFNIDDTGGADTLKTG